MATIKGGEFLIKEIKYQDIFITEEFNEEQKMMKEAVIEFVASNAGTFDLESHVSEEVVLILTVE